MLNLLHETILILLACAVLTIPISIVLGMFGSPFVPSNRKTVDRMLVIAKIKPGEHVVDLGAGDGRIVFAATKHGAIAEGYERSWHVWLIAQLRKYLTRSTGVIHCRNLFAADLSKADIVFCYLMPEVMARLAPKFAAELRPGARIISASFELAGWEAIREHPAEHGAKRIFEYRKK